MKTLSMDLRERIVAGYDRKEGTMAEIAARFVVSVGMVKKLLLQRRRTGSLENRRHRCGRKPLILESHRQTMTALLKEEPDLTLEALRGRPGLECTLPAIHYVLKKMGLTYKKRRSGPVSRTGRMLSAHAANGRRSSRASSPQTLFSSTNPPPKPI